MIFDRFIEMHNKTLISLLGFTLSILGWTLWNVILSYLYSTKEHLAYAVKGGFIKHFGANGIWWITVAIIIVAVCIWELGIKSLRKTFWPQDADVFQVLEKDPVLRKRFMKAARGALTYGDERDRMLFEDDEGEKEEEMRREEEVRQLLGSRKQDGSDDEAVVDVDIDFDTGVGRNSLSLSQRARQRQSYDEPRSPLLPWKGKTGDYEMEVLEEVGTRRTSRE
jgi:phospholipid-translocating ATPase